ncbi:MAG TPA: hypothetical protein VHS06_11150 [Chloroflexota bacterium]|nr:hypothetical protein [Chloroflexota bacterium]
MSRASLILLAVLLVPACLVGCGGRPPDQPGVSTAGTGLTGKIIFCSNRRGNEDIYVLTLSPVSTVRVINHPAKDRHPVWSPDGTKFAFVSDRSGPWQIWLANADGTGVTRLTHSGKCDTDPAWSPDGSRLAFARWDPDPDVHTHFICTVNADGSGARRITALEGYCYDPDWAPDGSRIAYTARNADGNVDIYTMNASDGSGRTRLTNDPAPDSQPKYSPDGGRIVFTSGRGGAGSSRLSPHSLWIMQATGAGEVPVGAGMSDDSAVWSPDGQHLAFNGYGSPGGFDLYSIRPNGTERTQLNSSAGYNQSPSWWQPAP